MGGHRSWTVLCLHPPRHYSCLPPITRRARRRPCEGICQYINHAYLNLFFSIVYSYFFSGSSTSWWLGSFFRVFSLWSLQSAAKCGSCVPSSTTISTCAIERRVRALTRLPAPNALNRETLSHRLNRATIHWFLMWRNHEEFPFLTTKIRNEHNSINDCYVNSLTLMVFWIFLFYSLVL